MTARCELCGKLKLKTLMVKYYHKKRSDDHRVMRKCQDCDVPGEEQMEE